MLLGQIDPDEWGARLQEDGTALPRLLLEAKPSVLSVQVFERLLLAAATGRSSGDKSPSPHHPLVHAIPILDPELQDGEEKRNNGHQDAPRLNRDDGPVEPVPETWPIRGSVFRFGHRVLRFSSTLIRDRRQPARRDREAEAPLYAYDTAEFVRTCKAFGAEAHAARNTAGRRSNIGEEMAASEGYQASQVHRKRIEEVFVWVKTVARLSKTRHRGLARVDWQFTLALAAYDLIRLPKLLKAAP